MLLLCWCSHIFFQQNTEENSFHLILCVVYTKENDDLYTKKTSQNYIHDMYYTLLSLCAPLFVYCSCNLDIFVLYSRNMKIHKNLNNSGIKKIRRINKEILKLNSIMLWIAPFELIQETTSKPNKHFKHVVQPFILYGQYHSMSKTWHFVFTSVPLYCNAHNNYTGEIMLENYAFHSN